MSTDEQDDESHICVNCQLAATLTEWRDSGAPVEDVVEAISDLVQNILYAHLDEIFSETDAEIQKATH
jgi:hypothetical protein